MSWKILSVILFSTFYLRVDASWGETGDVEEAQRLYQQAFQLYQQGNYTEAARLGEQVLAIQEKALGPEHPDTAETLSGLALVYDHLGEYAKALPLNQRALAIREKVLGPEHPATARQRQQKSA